MHRNERKSSIKFEFHAKHSELSEREMVEYLKSKLPNILDWKVENIPNYYNNTYITITAGKEDLEELLFNIRFACGIYGTLEEINV